MITGDYIMMIALRCHQTWLENPRVQWRFVAGENHQIGGIFQPWFDYTGGYMNNGRIISLPLFSLRILRMIIPVPKCLDLEKWTAKPW